MRVGELVRIGALAVAVVMTVTTAAVFRPAPALAFLDDLLVGPKTLIDLAIEARSSEDIVSDNRIVVEVNAVMAELGTISASTEIYEQRLLVTGIFEDQATYDAFRQGVAEVEGIKALYWHAVYLSESEQETRSDELVSWGEAMALDAEVGVTLIATAGVADVNLRVAADAFATIYLLGRARSPEEMEKAFEQRTPRQPGHCCPRG
jgi:hyperosmotically inducible protein